MNNFLYIFILSSGIFAIGIVLGRGLGLQVNNQLATIIFNLWKVIGILLLLSFCLSFFDVYFRGYWTTKLFIWMFVIIAAFLAAVGNRISASKWMRSILTTIAIVPAFCTVFYLAAGVAGGLLMHFVLVRVGGSNEFILYSDKTFRIERDNRGFRNPRSPRIFEKVGLIEIDRGFIECTNKPDSVKLAIRQDSIICYCYDKAYQESRMENPHVSTLLR